MTKHILMGLVDNVLKTKVPKLDYKRQYYKKRKKWA